MTRVYRLSPYAGSLGHRQPCPSCSSLFMGYYSTMRPIVKKNLVWGMLTGRVTGMGLPAPREALIKSLSDFILGILCNARNNSTQIANYLRQQSCIGLLSQGKLIGQPLKGKRFNEQVKRQRAAGLQVLCRTCTLSLHIKAPSFYPWPSYDEAVYKNPYEIWLYELISASLAVSFQESWPAYSMNSILEHGTESAAGGSVFLAARS